MKLKCNIFKGIFDRDCSNVTDIMKVLKAIKNGRWMDDIAAVRDARDKKQDDLLKQLKHSLPAVTWSGVFEERVDDACVVYNNLMVVDIDDISDRRLKRLKIELKENPWVFSYFDGPTKGIKILVFIDSPQDWHNTHAFQYIEEAFSTIYNIEIDASGKNISRLCFVSYDPDMYVNPNPQALHIEKTENSLEGFSSIKKMNFGEGVPSNDTKYIFDICKKMVSKSKTGSYHKGNRNNYIFVLSCLMCEFGVNPEQTFSLVSMNYRSLPPKEISNTIASAYRRNQKNYNTRIATEYKKNNNQQSLL